MTEICYFCLNKFNKEKDKNYHQCIICVDKYCHKKCWKKYLEKNKCPCCRNILNIKIVIKEKNYFQKLIYKYEKYFKLIIIIILIHFSLIAFLYSVF